MRDRQSFFTPSKAIGKFSKPDYKTIISVINNIIFQNSEQTIFLELLKQRCKEFNDALAGVDKASNEYQNILKQYYNFTITLESCFKAPDTIETKIRDYQDYSIYYPVGKLDATIPFYKNKRVLFGLAIGLILIAGGTLFCLMGPLAFGVAALAFAALAIIVSLALLLNDRAPKAKGIQSQEKVLFEEISNLYDAYNSPAKLDCPAP